MWLPFPLLPDCVLWVQQQQKCQALFLEAECFVHILSLLNGEYEECDAHQLCLDVVVTLNRLLAFNEPAKVGRPWGQGLGFTEWPCCLMHWP